MSTFVSIGNASQPFARLLDAVLLIADRLPQPVIIQHGNTPVSAGKCVMRAFVGMEEFANLVASADLLILHAGAGSVIHAVRAGKVPVVVPRRAAYDEHVDDHQVELARTLHLMGKVIMAESSIKLESAAREALLRQRSRSQSELEPPMLSLIREALERCTNAE